MRYVQLRLRRPQFEGLAAAKYALRLLQVFAPLDPAAARLDTPDEYEQMFESAPTVERSPSKGAAGEPQRRPSLLGRMMTAARTSFSGKEQDPSFARLEGGAKAPSTPQSAPPPPPPRRRRRRRRWPSSTPRCRVIRQIDFGIANVPTAPITGQKPGTRGCAPRRAPS